ncbi:MAG: hypothetical protein CM15mP128_2550 [Methanobacteriota archaeon]|nr:MAG: hypothetical protein CM15mP128_2550 [Euryarchaeota archaeon]
MGSETANAMRLTTAADLHGQEVVGSPAAGPVPSAPRLMVRRLMRHREGWSVTLVVRDPKVTLPRHRHRLRWTMLNYIAAHCRIGLSSPCCVCNE